MDYVFGYTILNDVSARDLGEGSTSPQGSVISRGSTPSACRAYITLREDVPNQAISRSTRTSTGCATSGRCRTATPRSSPSGWPSRSRTSAKAAYPAPRRHHFDGVPCPRFPLKEGQTVGSWSRGWERYGTRWSQKPAADHVKFPAERSRRTGAISRAPDHGADDPGRIRVLLRPEHLRPVVRHLGDVELPS